MLRHLQIRDFAIIEALEVEFGAGLTVLTGETGAGKSIIVDALELICGGRASAEVIRNGAERADISATLDISQTGGELRQLLEEHSIASEGELILRRVIGSDGRSRAWINAQTVPVQLLRQITELLCDIHGQHEFQSLTRAATQRELLDSFGQLDPLAGRVNAAHRTWHAMLNRALELESASGERHARVDLLRHELMELQALKTHPGEFADLMTERTRLSQSDRLLDAAHTAQEAIYEAEGASAHALIARALSALRPVSAIDERLAGLPSLLEEAAVRIKDVAHTLSGYLDALELDPQRQEAVESRLAAMEELARKHRIRPAELAEREIGLAAELAGLDRAVEDLGTLREQLATALAEYRTLAQLLSLARQKAAGALSREVSARMQDLGMSGGRLMISVEPLEGTEPSPSGIDRVEFRVSTNPGQPARALAKVASGGELARLSLAVQVSCARHAAPLMVFDEVDAGIGGAVAEIVGRELRTLGAVSQVLCVTHLPQVAAQGHQHLKVLKQTDGRTTRTALTVLDAESRVAEIARMLGGIDVTARARDHAVEMLQQAAAPAPASADTATTRRTRRPAPGRA